MIELEQLISMENPINAQYIQREKICLNLRKKVINREEAIKGLVNALEQTIKFEQIKAVEDPYITKTERTCIHNIAKNLKDIENDYFRFLSRICRKIEVQNTVYENIRMYAFIMSFIANTLGTHASYDESNIISQNIVKKCLQCKRLSDVFNNMYSMLWNDNESACISQNVYKEQLEVCMMIAHFCNAEYFVKYIQNKLNQIKI